MPYPPILKYAKKKAVRILRPEEFQAIRTSSFRPVYHAWLDGLLAFGGRYVEAQRLRDNPAWFTPPYIHLPPLAVLKVRRTQLDRYVKLSQFGVQAIGRFLLVKRLPAWGTFYEHIIEWAAMAGLETVGLGPKTLRKTYESWLAFTYPQSLDLIAMRQGHTTRTAVAHYLNLPFTEQDREAMRPFVEGIF